MPPRHDDMRQRLRDAQRKAEPGQWFQHAVGIGDQHDGFVMAQVGLGHHRIMVQPHQHIHIPPVAAEMVGRDLDP